MVDHHFGGPWTEIKLDAIEYYLQCYTKALKRVDFDLTYIDGFAGTGSREAQRTVGGLFEGIPIATIKETLAGSARRAIAVQPSFDHFVFIEMDSDRCAALDEIKTEFPKVDIKIIPGEANKILCGLVEKEPWLRKDTRAFSDRAESEGIPFRGKS